MGHGRSLGDLFRATQPEHSDRQHPGSHHSQHHPGPLDGATTRPTQDDALIYLEQLSEQYRLPRKLVFGVADAESGINPATGPHHNTYRDRRGRLHRSTDYGFMQVNDKTWFGKSVKDANGRPFQILGREVEHDWRANARAGVAIL